MEQLVFKIPVYEGPLDLLLALIAKNKMDIRDIQISLIFEQYMEYVEDLKKMDMEVAGEFITMASELMLIKSKMLLPKAEEEDPREELVRVLMEYKAAKQAAGWLSEQEKNFAGRYEKDTDEIKPDKNVLIEMDVNLLTRVLEKVLLRMGERRREEEEEKRNDRITPLLKRTVVPISEKIFSVLRFLYRRHSAHFEELFDGAKSRSEIVAIFYATLELLKSGRIGMEKEIGDTTNSNVILRLNPEHRKEEENTDHG